MKRDVRSNEAALKYLLIGGASTSILLYGFSFFYGLSGGKIEIYELSKALIDKHSIYPNVYWIALTCIIAAIAFKISAAPFHQWAPDVYEGSPTPVAAFFSVSSKAAGLALAVRVFSITLPFFQPQQQLILQACAILSMILGNVIAITQTSMKRMLAYSSIGQIGYLMIGLISATDNGYTSLLIYLSIYLFMNLGAFACVILFGLRTGTDEIRSYTGLFYKDPWLTCCLSICLLSLAGIPPFAGFFGKIYLFWAGWESGLYSLVIVGLITSVISMYYYLRVMKAMIVKEPTEMSFYTQNYKSITNLAFSSPLQISINICTLFCLVLGILMSPLAQLFQQASIFNALVV
uniref:subunit 2 of NADH-plastoquinone oxidoreductase n=1 Tax=Streptofilum capillatum TaxID=2058781 RepID=UPI00286B49F8|nr:subunit 2 of NADH-plastoquinone oxidoreductase [Streptofilum capillatum]WKT08528.1 subunit 2 of NADH-plastoquinone oxidoreductase [Streptofilum capillatum]